MQAVLAVVVEGEYEEVGGDLGRGWVGGGEATIHPSYKLTGQTCGVSLPPKQKAVCCQHEPLSTLTLGWATSLQSRQVK